MRRGFRQTIRGIFFRIGSKFQRLLQGGKEIKLCDFATAGCRGVRYRSWLPVAKPLPQPVTTRVPADLTVVGRQGSWFRWNGPAKTNASVSGYELAIAKASAPDRELVHVESIQGNRIKLTEPVFDQFQAGETYLWRVITLNANGRSVSVQPATRFRFDPAAPFIERKEMTASLEGPNGIIIDAPLHGTSEPVFGNLDKPVNLPAVKDRNDRDDGAIECDGSNMLVYKVEEFPEEDFSVAIWINILELPKNHLGQIFSAWCGPGDDPLRIVIDNGKLFARIENPGHGSATEGVSISTNAWHHIAAVKAGPHLKFYVDGAQKTECDAPVSPLTNSHAVALGGNPKFSGNEFLQARFADFQFYARALAESEIRAQLH